MNKIFKLIQKYPGSPELGDEVTNLGSNINEYFHKGLFRISHPEQYPKFWQEVKEEKDYEIMSFIDSSNDPFKGMFLVKKTNGLFQWNHLDNEGNCTVEELLEIKQYLIHSVKRLSDSVVFTIGDTVLCEGRHREVITSIDIFQKNYLKYSFEATGNSFTTESQTEDMQKVPEALFTTEDGVDLFEGDSYWFFWNALPIGKGQKLHTTYGKFTAYKLDEDESKAENAKFFSSKKACETYLEMNKPEFSRNDIINFLKTSPIFTGLKDKEQEMLNYFIKERK